jgi:plastocyanin
VTRTTARTAARSALAVVACTLVVLLVLPVTAAAEQRLRPASGIPTVRVRMVDGNDFRPRRIEVSRGTRVRWLNADNVAHTTTSNDGLWSSRVSPGGTFARRFRRAGEFDYRCTIHLGMTGVVVVS